MWKLIGKERKIPVTTGWAEILLKKPSFPFSSNITHLSAYLFPCVAFSVYLWGGNNKRVWLLWSHNWSNQVIKLQKPGQGVTQQVASSGRWS